jgi:orotidine-5'-phosphate decarboxylase
MAYTQARDRIIVALDVPTLDKAEALVRELSGHVGVFKVGLELLSAEGSARVVSMVHRHHGRVFYDAKFSDIPNTMAGAARSVAALEAAMFTVHASAGREALRQAIAARGQSMVLAVTVLTSLDDAASAEIFGAPAAEKVVALARLAAEAGAQGIVCSPLELRVLRATPGLESIFTVVPGIRPEWASAGDQARVMTPREAIAAGASAIVVGRPITRPPAGTSRVEAAERIAAEVEEALSR